jgi:cysteine desulfurase/selenocysteine lyase
MFSASVIESVRSDFPALHQMVYNKPLVYLDNAATTQKPNVVIRRLQQYYELENSNIHRGVHYLSQQATVAFEQARQFIAHRLNASSSTEIIFTRGTTESVNLVASSLGKILMKPGSSVLVTALEHHSNFVPWQQLCNDCGGKLLIARLNIDGSVDMDHFSELLEQRPAIVALAHISNALGTVNPVKEMVRMAHQYDIPVLVDGAQSIAHQSIDVQDIDCDFFVFSGHKAYAPMGVGVLYGKEQWLLRMPPYQYGGEMVDQVGFEQTSFNVLPFKFEAGTPNVGAVLALESALRYLDNLGMENIAAYEKYLLEYLQQRLAEVNSIRFIGQAAHKAAVCSFLIGSIHPYDLGTLLDKMGVAVRTGHHCAQPVMDVFNIPGTVRASIALYTTTDDIDKMVEAVKKASAMLL